MAIYSDSRGWLYKVMPGLGGDTFKARYHKPEYPPHKWKCVMTLPWRASADEANADLERLAREKGWRREETENEQREGVLPGKH